MTPGTLLYSADSLERGDLLLYQGCRAYTDVERPLADSRQLAKRRAVAGGVVVIPIITTTTNNNRMAWGVPPAELQRSLF